jgi:hypothetical protein
LNSDPVTRRNRCSRTARTTCHSGPPGEGRRTVGRREDEIGIARRDRFDAHWSRRGRDVAEEVGATGSLHQLAEKAAPADRHRGLLPHQQEDRRPVALGRRDGSRSERRIEGRREGVGGVRPAGQPAEQAADPVDVGQSVGIDPQRRNTQAPKSGRHGGVLGRIVEHHEVGPGGEDRLDIGIDAIPEVGGRARPPRDSRTRWTGRRRRLRRRWRTTARSWPE